ncbi:hypothetical protein LIER_10355 [Lithospermum erythrorhizon]|uniref:Integrase zinc-binding domain-containing protein n=1 Tax=Lithospermum erythrorhizon TaxID=34254 RepID=A0AAV3PKZ5_LITER
MEEVKNGIRPDFAIKDDGMLTMYGGIFVSYSNELKREILEEAHNAPYSMHPGSTKMYRDLRTSYWWPKMKRETAEFVAKCLTCQQVKIEHRHPAGLLQPLPIPEWTWEHITMDFVFGLPKTFKRNDGIWVIVDRLSKLAHFIPIRSAYGPEQLAKLYVDQIVRLHGVPVTIV